MKKKLQLPLKLISQNQSVTRRLISQKLVSYMDSSNEEEEHLHYGLNFDEPIDLVIN